ncbi:helix-turn-helix domain-containing protein [Paludibacterium denitrificans]|uniref:helix-turn-helix domain-containing protein n=1 Tax=Paludibacterium denitrificans TaxID=2675226 RepID=UPI001E4F1155|nr:helix-turn-helix transcriptional regulator [Paludibacterium denitrificans]
MQEQTVARDYRAMRRALGLNQSQFWSAVKVTQSGGSRYESGRKAPAQVDEMVRLRHELGIDITLITPENADVIRAILLKELDAKELLDLANRCRELMVNVGKVATDLVETSVGVNTMLTGKTACVEVQ